MEAVETVAELVKRPPNYEHQQDSSCCSDANATHPAKRLKTQSESDASGVDVDDVVVEMTDRKKLMMMMMAVFVVVMILLEQLFPECSFRATLGLILSRQRA